MLLAWPLLLFFPAAPISAQNAAPFQDAHARADSLELVRSLIVSHQGEIIHTRFWNEMEPDRDVNIKSASKSVISLLVGIALEEGYLKSLDQTLSEFFPEYFAAHPDSVKANITLRNLLTMRSGLQTTSFWNYGRWVVSDNWVKFVLSQPMEDQAGGPMIYSTGTTHLLSAILTRQTGMSTRAFAEKVLFDPLGIRLGGWDRDPQGIYFGGNNMAMSPMEMHKIGRMMLQNGRYGGKQIVPKAWVREATATYTTSPYNGYDYGYLWWSKPAAEYDLNFAWGYGGQFIFFVRKLDLCVVITSGIYNERKAGYIEGVIDMVESEIIPIAERRMESLGE